MLAFTVCFFALEGFVFGFVGAGEILVDMDWKDWSYVNATVTLRSVGKI